MNYRAQKGFAMPAIIAIVAIILVLVGSIYYYYTNKSTEVAEMVGEKAMIESETMKQEEDGVMMEKTENMITEQEGEEMMEGAGAMMEENGGMIKYSGATLAGESSPLLDFIKADYDAAVKTDKLIVLYFYANWCPICRAEFPVMQKVFNELNTDQVIGFRINYNDNQTDGDEKSLAKQFGVAYQHTKVFVKNGQRILKSPEGWNEGRYNMEINKALNQ